MVDNENSQLLIEEINELMKYNKNDDSSLSPFALKYLDLDELIDIRDNLLRSRKYLKEETIKWFDELYEKTKKDEF